MNAKRLRAATVLLLALGAVVLPGTAQAAPPGNDDFANAVTADLIAGSFSDSVELSDATAEAGEPQACYGVSQTAWYRITVAETTMLRIFPGPGSFFDSLLNVYRQNGAGLGGLSFMSCGTFGSSVMLEAEAGETYYVQAAKINGGLGTLSLGVEAVPAPPNDDLSDGATVGVLPFSGSADTSGATTESGEPTPSCGYGQSAGTVWYTFTPAVTGSYTASAPSAGPSAQVAVYTGTGIGTLVDRGCRAFGSPLTFQGVAGETYHLQVGGLFGNRGNVMLALDAAPDPVVSIGLSIGDPSIFDTMQFFDQSFDPGQVGIESRMWNFGDGSLSSEQYPTHRYLSDGSYEVRLTVTTYDGRTASTTQSILVRTHDVTISKLTVPNSASTNQTRSITVGITNGRYPEDVQVALYKSVPSGWQQVGFLTQRVPVRGANRTTSFSFNYTFTTEDAALGKVSFQAVATIAGARDALPADNAVVSLPTKVN